MRTITKRIKVYKFSELGEEAKEAVKQRDKEAWGYSHHDECLETMKELAKHFGWFVRDDWEIDWFGCERSRMSFQISSFLSVGEIEERLAQLGEFNSETGKGLGDCELTGVCWDEDAIDGFRKTWGEWKQENPDKVIADLNGEEPDDDEITVNLGAMLKAAFENVLAAGMADCEDQYTDERFGENCDANGYEFTKEGKLWKD